MGSEGRSAISQLSIGLEHRVDAGRHRHAGCAPPFVLVTNSRTRPTASSEVLDEREVGGVPVLLPPHDVPVLW